MKKKNVFVCGIFAVALIIALAFTACDQPDNPVGPANQGGNPDTPGGTGGKLTVNNLPGGATHAVYVFASGTDISTFTAITNAYSSASYQAVGASPSGNVFDLTGWNGTSATNGWTGSGSFPVLLFNASGSTTGTENPMYSWATISFTGGNGAASYSSFTAVVYGGGGPIDPIDPNNPKGKLTIINLSAGNSLAITVYNYDGEITSQMDLTGVQTDLSKLAAVSFGLANSSPASLVKSGGSTSAFDGTGTYLVIMAVNTTSVRYAEQVEFTDGCAEINFDTLLNMIDLPLIYTVRYNVIFNPNGGNWDGSTNNKTEKVEEYNTVSEPDEPARQFHNFGGWYTENTFNDEWDFMSDTVSENIILYAKWILDKDAISAFITSQAGGASASDLANLPLEIDLGSMTQTDSNWKILLEAIDDAQKYVNLDLSDSTMTGTEFNPDYNFSTGKSYIVGITLPNTATSISGSGWYNVSTFNYFNNLASITIPNSVTSIGNRAFQGCTSLASITIPNSVISIGDNAFNGSGLTSITIPNSVTSIEDGTFSDCTSLTSVTIPNSVTTIGGSAFQGCTSLTSITIPNSVTDIGVYAFQDCTSLASVTIGNSVTTIGGSAFYNCTSLASVTFTPTSKVTSIGGAAFYNCNKLTSITIPYGVTSIEDSTFYNCTSLTSVTIPNSVTIICGKYLYGWYYQGEGAFKGCSSLTSIIIPNSVTDIQGSVFENCTSLASVTFTPTSKVTSIGVSTFAGCTKLDSVNIPNSVTSIGGAAFYGCTSLTSLIIPDSVTGIGNNAFNNCSGLTSVTIPDSVISLGDQTASSRQGVFQDCTSLASVNIGNGVTIIRKYTFYNCTSLASVTIGNNVTSIEGEYSFGNCTSLTNITIPNSVTSIGGGWEGAFQGCTSLASVTIGNSVTSIGSNAFYNCTSLASVRFERADTTFITTTVQPSFINTANSTSLQTAYTAGGIGTYTRPDTTSTTWSKVE